MKCFRACLLILVFGAQLAFAHVTVTPDKSAPGKPETYAFRVPNEKDGTTTIKFELQIPAEIGHIFFEAMPGWKLTFDKDSTGKIIRATWSGGSVGPSEYAQFRCAVRNPQNVPKLMWRAVQYYADGTKDEWTGEAGSRRPAPTTTLSAE